MHPGPAAKPRAAVIAVGVLAAALSTAMSPVGQTGSAPRGQALGEVSPTGSAVVATLPLPAGHRSTEANIAVDPTDPSDILVAARDEDQGRLVGLRMWRSRDRGRSFHGGMLVPRRLEGQPANAIDPLSWSRARIVAQPRGAGDAAQAARAAGPDGRLWLAFYRFGTGSTSVELWSSSTGDRWERAVLMSSPAPRGRLILPGGLRGSRGHEQVRHSRVHDAGAVRRLPAGGAGGETEALLMSVPVQRGDVGRL